MTLNLLPCLKSPIGGLDKAVPARQTLERVETLLGRHPLDILNRLERIDTGRLGIPVYLSYAGKDASRLMPGRKQMGKGARPDQARASALMELLERYAFFSFWEDLAKAERLLWDEAEVRYPGSLMTLQEILQACQDDLAPATARRIMNLRSWAFHPATQVRTGEMCHTPLELFRTLNEFNGSSAGNTDTESVLQGACELIERHVCCLAAESRPVLPTIHLDPVTEPAAHTLARKFSSAGIKLLLKDFSLGYPVPTVAALAYDPETLGSSSELVFTAGTATSPEKAAIRALTEVAQLAGDFCTSSCYEPSGLPKYAHPDQAAWLRSGPVLPLASLPCIADSDMLAELKTLCNALENMGGHFAPENQSGFAPGTYRLYSFSTAGAKGLVPCHYSFIPGFRFREREQQASLGLFVGRLLVEDGVSAQARNGLSILDQVYPHSHFVPFYLGLLALKKGDRIAADRFFSESAFKAPDDDARSMALFYRGYARSQDGDWKAALPHLLQACELCPDMKEYQNLKGVALFRLDRLEEAAATFGHIVTNLDKGSATDWQNLGLCHERTGNHAQAIQNLSAALSLDPSLETARTHLGNLQHGRGRDA